MQKIAEPYTYLALAVVELAMRETRAKDDHVRMRAKSWLYCGAPVLFEIMGIDYNLDDFLTRILKRRKRNV